VIRYTSVAPIRTISAALRAIDPKYEKWVSLRWDNYAPIKATIDLVHGPDFYDL
jgi:hypothetical protein